MAFQSVPDTALFTAEFTAPDGGTPSFSLASRNTAAPWDATQLGTVADAIADAIVDDYCPLLGTDVTFVRMVARDLEVENGRVMERTAVNEAGAVASPSLPANCAVRAKFIGSPGGFPARGGCFLLAPTESQVVGSIIAGATVTALQAAVESIAAAAGLSSAAHVIISRYQGTTETDGPGNKVFRTPIKRDVAETNTVDDIVVQERIASQRKRRPRAS